MTCKKADIKQSKCMKMTVDCAGMVKTWFLNFNNDGQWTQSAPWASHVSDLILISMQCQGSMNHKTDT